MYFFWKGSQPSEGAIWQLVFLVRQWRWRFVLAVHLNWGGDLNRNMGIQFLIRVCLIAEGWEGRFKPWDTGLFWM